MSDARRGTMGATPAATDERHRPEWYASRRTGYRDACGAAGLAGRRLAHAGDGTTLVHGPVVDQAALHGLLRKVRDVGLPLVSVSRVDPNHPDAPTIEPR